MKAILVAGGKLNNKLLSLINPHDFLVGVDAGALFLLKQGFRCNLAIGDFDSVSQKELKLIKNKVKEVISYKPDKDYTDTELAIREVQKRGYREILILGAIGMRLDHTLANIFLLENGVKIIDENNEIELVYGQKIIEKSEQFKYVSFISLSDFSTLSLSGFKYPLKNKKIKRGQTLCLSNEIVEDKAVIQVSQGEIIMIKAGIR